MTEYTKQARDFMQKYGAHMTIKRLGEEKAFGRPYLSYSYRVTISRNGKRYTCIFHDSVANHDRGIEPDEYDILSCLEKYDPGTIDDFVSEYGYEINSWDDVRQIKNTYKAVVREYNGVMRLFGDVIDELAEIA